MKKSVLVIGLGKSGRAVSKLLFEQGYRVFGFDEELKRIKNVVSLRENEIDKVIDEISFCVISPGVSPYKDYVKKIEKKVKIYSEIEVAYWFLKDKKIISITGTNGKTTTTLSLIHI